jgi:cytoskeletal protein CcmA (bactofilin family)
VGLFGKSRERENESSGSAPPSATSNSTDSVGPSRGSDTGNTSDPKADSGRKLKTVDQSRLGPKGSGAGSASQSGTKGSSDRASRERGATPQTGGKSVATIGKSIIIKGDLSGDEDLIIDGKVEGRVQLPNNQITIGADGRISADIEAKAIIVVGKTAGNLNASEMVEVQATGSVEGDIIAPRLQIQEGAIVNGNISMTKAPVSVEKSDPNAANKTASIGEQTRKSA